MNSGTAGVIKRHPAWIRVKLPVGDEAGKTAEIIGRHGLRTVCRDARCPNAGECWTLATATFLVLGGICTGACRFCSVAKGTPVKPDPSEPERVARGIAELGLRHAVITSVTRSDLPDGGAGHFAETVRAIRAQCPGVTIEVLVPDFAGSRKAVDTVLDSGVEVFGHNIETVPRLYSSLRPRASYPRSLAVLGQAAASGRTLAKTAILLGMGEEPEEVLDVMRDIRSAGVTALALGQYLKPGEDSTPVARYLPPEEFDLLRDKALGLGFVQVMSGPFVRSSYRAGEYLGRTVPA